MAKVEGTDAEELKRRLDRIAAKARRPRGEPPIPLQAVFTDSFMQRHTTYQSWEEMLDQSPFRVKSKGSFTNAQWDTFVRASTTFASWKEMLKAAAKEMFKRELEMPE